MANVVYEHVSKKFGEVSAVSDLSIEVRDGEFLVLVGPSGCGKSTTLRLVAGLEEITSGNIFIGDRKVNDVAPKDRDIAMVFQSYALYPHMSVYDNLAFGLRLRKVPKNEIDRRVRSTGEMLGISELLDRKPKQLSGGQRQRVAVGRAIVRDPQVFLLDEPLSNLDAKLRIQTRAELTKLHQRLKTTTIYVTHDQTEAMTMGSRIAVLKDGILQQLDTPQQLYDKPRNMFVAGFIGSPSMNFFDASLEGSAADLWVKTRAFKVKVPSNLAPDLAKHKDRDLVFGLRPEDFSDSTLLTTKNPDQTINVDIDVVELMGSETYVYMVNEGSTFIGRFDPRTKVQPGMKIQSELDMGNMHLFDRQTQEALV